MTIGVIMVGVNAINIGNAQTGDAVVGLAWPRAYPQFGGGLWLGKGPANGFSAKIGDNPLKKLIS